jgi:hypothetical protein
MNEAPSPRERAKSGARSDQRRQAADTAAARKYRAGSSRLVHARLVIDYHHTLICHHETWCSVRQRRC